MTKYLIRYAFNVQHIHQIVRKKKKEDLYYYEKVIIWKNDPLNADVHNASGWSGSQCCLIFQWHPEMKEDTVKCRL